MAQTVKLKRSAVSGNTPTTSDLALGEIAINTYDGNIFIKKNDGTESIVTFSPGSNAGTIEEDSFSGNGSTTAFTLSSAPSSEEHLLVFIDATFQNRDSFTISGTTITFDTAPDNGSSVRVYHVIPGSVDDGVLTVAKFAADTLVLESEGIASNDNDTTIPTSAAVKDYVDTQVATVDTLPEVLANGNTTGGTDISVSTGDDITFADSSKAIFGAGSDLQIYHDGSHSYIEDAGTGSLIIEGTDLNLRANDNSRYLVGTDGSGGSTALYHPDGDSIKLATTSTGIDVTGTVTSDGLTVDGDIAVNDSSPMLTLTDTDGTNQLGRIFQAGATLFINSRDNTSFGAIDLVAANGSQTYNRLTINSGGDISFYEDTGTTAKLFWDASAEQLLLGITATAAGGSLVAKTDSNGYGIAIEENSGSERWSLGVDVDGDLNFINSADTTPTVTFNDAGNVGIGTDNPAASLHLTGSNVNIALEPTGTNAYFDNRKIGGTTNFRVSGSSTNDTNALSINSSGNATFAGTISSGAITATGEVEATALDINGNGDISGNLTLGGYLAGPATFTIDPAAVGDNTGTVVIAGNLQVDGTTTTINSTTLTVDDKLVTLASGSINAAAANGAGIEVDITGSTNPSLTYDGTNDEWDFNKSVNINGTITSGKISASFSSSHTTGTISHSNAALDLYNPLEANTNEKGTIITFSDNYYDGTNYIKTTRAAIKGGTDVVGNTADGYLAFYTDSGAANTANERLRIDKDGNVGIGTTSPSAKLEVTGATLVSDDGADDFVKQSVSGTTSTLSFGNTESTGGIAKWQYNRSTGGFSGFVGLAAGTNFMTVLGSGNVGISTTSPDFTLDVEADKDTWISRIYNTGSDANAQTLLVRSDATAAHDATVMGVYADSGYKMVVKSTGNVGIGNTSPATKLQVEEYGIDTTETSTTATTQVAIHTFAAATFRSARFTIQVTNSTDSTYHLTEILMIHDGTTPSITEYGTIFTGAAAEATFDADISSGNVRLLATPASTDTMEFKVVSHSITT